MKYLARFNSQRDGILPYHSRHKTARMKQFQFPTGWNSTHIRNSLDVMYHRFNSQRDGILPCQVSAFWGTILCFNSQRDGILPYRWRSCRDRSGVSIPNGMEFYSLASFDLASLFCFNSQRDGILLCLGNIPRNFQDVSIPNGMEFYAEQGFLS